jgi:hypothetical protein
MTSSWYRSNTAVESVSLPRFHQFVDHLRSLRGGD